MTKKKIQFPSDVAGQKKLKQKGILTLDFIFSMTAVYAISMLFILLAITLVMSTVVQYISFSMARSHISGDLTVEAQQDAVQEKMTQLLGDYDKWIKVTDEGWFKVETTGRAGAFSADSNWGGSSGASRQRSYGVAIRYTSNILKNIKLPLLGSPGDGATDDFGSANIFSFMYRHPTTEECLNFNSARWQSLAPRFNGLGGMPNLDTSVNGDQADNGC